MRLFLAASLLATFAASVQAATFTVTVTGDSSSGDCLPERCTLRAAMTAANANDPSAGADLIVLPAGTYTVGYTGVLPSVTQAVRLQGAGSGQTIVQTQSQYLFSAGAGADFTLAGLGIDVPFVGSGVGGAIALRAQDGARIALDDIVVKRGWVEFRAGTFAQIRHSELRHYLRCSGEASIEDSSIFNLLMDFQAEQADVTLRRVIVDSSTDPDPRPGAIPYIHQAAGTLTIEDSTITHSKAYIDGAAATLSLRRVHYIDNAGPIQTEAAASVTIENSLLEENTVRALYAAGGAQWNVSGSSFVKNRVNGNAGGAILLEDDTVLRVLNSTFSGNTFTAEAAADGARGAAIGFRHGSGAHLIVRQSTIAAPPSMPAGAIGSAIGGHDNGIAFDIGNSIVRGSCGMNSNVLQNNTGNIESPGDTCGLLAEQNRVNVSAANLALGALADNGGPTPTILPGAGSLAIDHASTPQCLPVDQRGYARPGGARCDVGAVEADADDTLFEDGFDA